MQKIEFSPHALLKFKILAKHNFILTQEQVLEVIKYLEKIEDGKKGKKIVKRKITHRYLLRVIYEDKGDYLEIITFYPALRSKYKP